MQIMTTMKKILIGIALLLIAIFFISLTQDFQFRRSSSYVNIDELFNNSSVYHEKYICTTGLYRSGFEVASMLASSDINGPEMWIETPITMNLKNRIYNILLLFQAYPTIQANVCGIFETKTEESSFGFGHLGGYEFQIIHN